MKTARVFVLRTFGSNRFHPCKDYFDCMEIQVVENGCLFQRTKHERGHFMPANSQKAFLKVVFYDAKHTTVCKNVPEFVFGFDLDQIFKTIYNNSSAFYSYKNTNFSHI